MMMMMMLMIMMIMMIMLEYNNRKMSKNEIFSNRSDPNSI